MIARSPSRRVTDQRPRTHRPAPTAPLLLPTLAAAGAALLGCAWFLVPTSGDVRLWPFVVAAVLGELLAVQRHGARDFRAAIAVTGTLALVGGTPLRTVAVAATGWLLAAAYRSLRGQRPRWGWSVEAAVAAWSLPGAAALGAALVPVPLGDAPDAISLGALAAVTLVTLVAPAAWIAATSPPPRHPLAVLRTELTATWAPSLAIASSAALAATAYGALGPVALVLVLLPLVAVRAGLERHAGIARTYEQTVVAMGHMTELTGHVAQEHGLRVARLAVDVARQLRLEDAEVRVVERAAHLHEVGRIVTDDPDQKAHDHEVAYAGAAIVREAGGMDGVATIIERLRDPYRLAVGGQDQSLPLASRIIRTVCEFDRLAGHDPAGTWTALEALHTAVVHDHDPRVVTALEAVLERR